LLRQLAHLPPQPAVLLFQLRDGSLAEASGRQRSQLFAPLFEALRADPQFTRDLLNGFAALKPQLHRRAFETVVVAFVFAWFVVFSVHGACV